MNVIQFFGQVATKYCRNHQLFVFGSSESRQWQWTFVIDWRQISLASQIVPKWITLYFKQSPCPLVFDSNCRMIEVIENLGSSQQISQFSQKFQPLWINNQMKRKQAISWNTHYSLLQYFVQNFCYSNQFLVKIIRELFLKRKLDK